MDERAEKLRQRGVHRADPSAPWCNNPACGLCSGLEEALCFGMVGQFRTACGTKIRRPEEPGIFVDKDGRVYRKPPVIFTFDINRCTCPKCKEALQRSSS